MADIGYGFRTGPFPGDPSYEGMNLNISDSDYLQFGDADDVSMGWDGTNLTIKPVADDTGAIVVGDGTTDMDVKVFLGTSAKYVLMDVGNVLLKLEDVDLHLGDNDAIEIGDATGGDVNIVWNATNLVVTPAANDTGSFIYGTGSKDMDVKVFLGGTGKYVVFDVGDALLKLEDVDLKLGDNDALQIGDATGGDVNILWNATNLVITPAANDTGAIYFGNGTTDMDVRFTMGAAADYAQFDVGAKAFITAGKARLQLDGLKSASCTDGTVIRMGTSGTPLSDAQNDGAGFVVGYFTTSHTSGWPAGMYLSTTCTGAGGNVTGAEGDVYLSAVLANATGIESFLGLNAAGGISGHAAACQATIDYYNGALPNSGGAYMAGRFNIKGEGSNCDPTKAIRIACVELQTQGTFKSNCDFEKHAAGYAIYINGFTAASGVTNILSSTSLAELPSGTLGLRVGVGADGAAGTAYYIPLVVATEWN